MIAFISEINSDNYDEFLALNNFVVVDIWASWCVSCKIFSPIIDAVSSEFFEEGVEVKIAKMNIDDNKDKATELGIRSIPTIIIYKDNVLVEQKSGMMTKTILKDMIRKYI